MLYEACTVTKASNDAFLRLYPQWCLIYKETERERRKDRISSLLVHAPNTCDGQGWAEASARSGQSVHMPHRSVLLGPSTPPPRACVRWVLNPGLRYGSSVSLLGSVPARRSVTFSCSPHFRLYSARDFIRHFQVGQPSCLQRFDRSCCF